LRREALESRLSGLTGDDVCAPRNADQSQARRGEKERGSVHLRIAPVLLGFNPVLILARFSGQDNPFSAVPPPLKTPLVPMGIDCCGGEVLIEGSEAGGRDRTEPGPLSVLIRTALACPRVTVLR